MEIKAGKYYRTDENFIICDDGIRSEAIRLEWTDEPAVPKTWGEMTDAEKGALLLAELNGRPIQVWQTYHKVWQPAFNKVGMDLYAAYRVCPPEPVRETVTKHIRRFGERWLMSTDRWSTDTHRITFATVNDEPDCNSIRMERIND